MWWYRYIDTMKKAIIDIPLNKLDAVMLDLMYEFGSGSVYATLQHNDLWTVHYTVP